MTVATLSAVNVRQAQPATSGRTDAARVPAYLAAAMVPMTALLALIAAMASALITGGNLSPSAGLASSTTAAAAVAMWCLCALAPCCAITFALGSLRREGSMQSRTLAVASFAGAVVLLAGVTLTQLL